MPGRIDITGETYNYLTVVEVAPRDGTSKIKWTCRCACGNTAIVAAGKLRSGHTRSCGSCTLRRSDAFKRFASRAMITSSGCIEWSGGLNGVGYGQFYRGQKYPGDTGKAYAHRWSYEYFIGEIPQGLHLDHLCRNRKCVNPTHLEPITLGENVLRGAGPSATNARKTHCPAGHPLDGENLYTHPTKGQRICRECGRRRAKAKRDRLKQEREAF